MGFDYCVRDFIVSCTVKDKESRHLLRVVEVVICGSSSFTLYLPSREIDNRPCPCVHHLQRLCNFSFVCLFVFSSFFFFSITLFQSFPWIRNLSSQPKEFPVCACEMKLLLPLAVVPALQVLAGPSPSNLVNPCLNATYSSLPFCNVSLPIDDRVNGTRVFYCFVLIWFRRLWFLWFRVLLFLGMRLNVGIFCVTCCDKRWN